MLKCSFGHTYSYPPEIPVLILFLFIFYMFYMESSYFQTVISFIFIRFDFISWEKF